MHTNSPYTLIFFSCILYWHHIILFNITKINFLGEPKTSTDTPKWTDNIPDNNANNNNVYSTIGGVKSLYVLLVSVTAVIGAIVLLIFFTVCIYSKRLSSHSNSPGKLFFFRKNF